jgi:two-component system sensor histidine kinase QseC
MTVLDELTTAGELRPELVAMARRSVRRLLRLSEQLALVSELETGTVAPAVGDVDLRAITSQALVDALAIDGRREVTATFRDHTRALVVGADSRILLLLVREVIGNALKLAGSRVEIAIGSADGLVELRVEDDGPGFSASSTSMLGQRFVTHASARGLGLSLSMAIEILRLHGGGVRIEPSSLPHGRHGLPGAAVVLCFRESKAP